MLLLMFLYLICINIRHVGGKGMLEGSKMGDLVENMVHLSNDNVVLDDE